MYRVRTHSPLGLLIIISWISPYFNYSFPRSLSYQWREQTKFLLFCRAGHYVSELMDLGYAYMDLPYGNKGGRMESANALCWKWEQGSQWQRARVSVEGLVRGSFASNATRFSLVVKICQTKYLLYLNERNIFLNESSLTSTQFGYR